MRIFISHPLADVDLAKKLREIVLVMIDLIEIFLKYKIKFGSLAFKST